MTNEQQGITEQQVADAINVINDCLGKIIKRIEEVEKYVSEIPTPDKTYGITISYDKEPETITDTTSTPAPATAGTYLSNKYQDLLLYACLVNTYGYLKGPQDMLQYYQGAYEKALYSYAIEQQGRRRRDEYADGVIRTVLASENPSSNK